VCIFAYGQTGSGKTYTMLGSEESRGIIPRAIHQIFEGSRKLGTQGWVFNMQVRRGGGGGGRRQGRGALGLAWWARRLTPLPLPLFGPTPPPPSFPTSSYPPPHPHPPTPPGLHA
jgi:hypothetical protein